MVGRAGDKKQRKKRAKLSNADKGKRKATIAAKKQKKGNEAMHSFIVGMAGGAGKKVQQ